METASFTWNTDPPYAKDQGKSPDAKKIKLLLNGIVKPRNIYKSSIMTLKTAPNDIVLKLQMVVEYNGISLL